MRDYLARFNTEKRRPLSFTSDSEKLRIKQQHNGMAGATHSHLYYSKELQKLTSKWKNFVNTKIASVNSLVVFLNQIAIDA